jgi:hypothetical protein
MVKTKISTKLSTILKVLGYPVENCSAFTDGTRLWKNFSIENNRIQDGDIIDVKLEEITEFMENDFYPVLNTKMESLVDQ